MLAPKELFVAPDVFFGKWPSQLLVTKNWDWAEMKRRLAGKPEGERWYILKDVATLQAEDGDVPYVPNYIILVYPADHAGALAPRLSLKAGEHDKWMDNEDFIPDDLVDMKERGWHWRELRDHAGCLVLTKAGAKTDAMPTLGFTAGASFGAAAAAADAGGAKRDAGDAAAVDEPAAKRAKPEDAAADAAAPPTFSFGLPDSAAAAPAASVQPAAEQFSFEAPAAPAGGFSFGGPPAAPAAAGGFSFGTGNNAAFDASAFGGGDAAMDDDEVAYPTLVDKEFVEMLREQISAGAKVMWRHKPDRDNIKVVVQNDYAWDAKPDHKKNEDLVKCLQKSALQKSENFQQLFEEYQGDSAPLITDTAQQEQRQKEYQEKRAAILAGEAAVKEAVVRMKRDELPEIRRTVREVVKTRREKRDRTRADLNALMADIRAGKMLDRSAVRVVRVFPEKDSQGAAHAFRPSKKINKALPDAADCYPEAYVAINPFTGQPM